MLTNLNSVASPGTQLAADAMLPGDPAPAVARRALRESSSRPVDAAAPAETLDRAALVAIDRLFAGRAVNVSSFHDDASGRMVYRVSDPHSGEVLMQEPSESLLRLYASSRQTATPLLAIEA